MNVTDEQVALLARFVKKIMADFPDFDALDLCDLQDIAEEHKILERHIVYSPCGENCNCAQFYSTEEMQAGVPCCRIAEWLDRAAELPLEPTTDGTNAATCNCYDIEHYDDPCPVHGMDLPGPRS